MRTIRGVVVAAALVLAAVGCGVSSEQVISPGGSGERADAAAPARDTGSTRAADSGSKSTDTSSSNTSGTVTAVALQRAVDETRAANTGRFTMTVEMSGVGDTDLDMTTRGAFDLDAGRFSSETDFSGLLQSLGDLDESGSLGGLADSMSMRTLIDGDTVYLQVPGLGGSDGSWMAMPLGEQAIGDLTSGGGPGIANPGDLLTQLRGVTGPLTEVGHESIGGVDTVHHRGVIDLKKILADHADELSANARSEVEAEVQQLGSAGEMPVDVWIGDDGLLRQQRITMNAPDGTGSISVTITFTDLGKPVDLAPPPADQVQRFDPNDPEALSSLFEGLGPGA